MLGMLGMLGMPGMLAARSAPAAPAENHRLPSGLLRSQPLLRSSPPLSLRLFQILQESPRCWEGNGVRRCLAILRWEGEGGGGGRARRFQLAALRFQTEAEVASAAADGVSSGHGLWAIVPPTWRFSRLMAARMAIRRPWNLHSLPLELVCKWATTFPFPFPPPSSVSRAHHSNGVDATWTTMTHKLVLIHWKWSGGFRVIQFHLFRTSKWTNSWDETQSREREMEREMMGLGSALETGGGGPAENEKTCSLAPSAPSPPQGPLPSH